MPCVISSQHQFCYVTQWFQFNVVFLLINFCYLFSGKNQSKKKPVKRALLLRNEHVHTAPS